MSTPTDPRITTLVDSMMSAGVPRDEATAIASAVEYALDSNNYAKIYGTVTVDALNNFLNRLT
jgi:hypothetical protein